MTLADIISDCFKGAGLSEMVEQAADDVVSEIFNGNNMRNMLADMVRDAMREGLTPCPFCNPPAVEG